MDWHFVKRRRKGEYVCFVGGQIIEEKGVWREGENLFFGSVQRFSWEGTVRNDEANIIINETISRQSWVIYDDWLTIN
jgi:hypothetical protein